MKNELKNETLFWFNNNTIHLKSSFFKMFVKKLISAIACWSRKRAHVMLRCYSWGLRKMFLLGVKKLRFMHYLREIEQTLIKRISQYIIYVRI